MISRPRHVAAVIAALAAMGCDDRPTLEQTKTVASPLTSASPDGTHPEVVAITKRRQGCESAFIESFCTGVLVAPGVILTAAHCALAESALDIEVFVGSDVNASGGRFHGVVAQAIHPGYDEQTFDNDLALLWLDEPMTVLPIVRGDEPSVGELVTVVGFGGDENGGGGQRRIGTSQVESISGDLIRTVAAPSLACGGDSGAPALRDGKLVGLVRSGDPQCKTFANLTRLDVAWQTFIGKAIASPPVPSRPVVANEQICRGPCVDDADCPRGMLCLPERELGNLCGYASLRSGTFGEVCTSDAACSSGKCAQVASGDLGRACRCFTNCRDLPRPKTSQFEFEGGCAMGTGTTDLTGLFSLGFLWSTAHRARRRTRAGSQRP